MSGGEDTPQRRETDWLFQRLNTLEEKIEGQHRRQNDRMAEGFEKLSTQIKNAVAENNHRLDDHSGRLIVIETERKAEAAQAIKKGALAGVLAATGLQAAMKALEHFWK